MHTERGNAILGIVFDASALNAGNEPLGQVSLRKIPVRLVDYRQVVRLDELLSAVHDQRVRRRIKIIGFAGIGGPEFLGCLRDLPTFAEIRGVIATVSNDRDENKRPRDAANQSFDKQAGEKQLNEEAREERTAQEHQVKARYRQSLECEEYQEKNKHLAGKRRQITAQHDFVRKPRVCAST